jgi:Fe-Mn family superoxide dismutase
MPPYALPDLGYDYGALEPHISGQIMELHHGKHHKGYVDKANETLQKLDEALGKDDLSRVAALEKSLAFNLSGHVLHSIFWKNLMPRGGDAPRGELARFITLATSGSFDAKGPAQRGRRDHHGLRWARFWVWEPMAQRLVTRQIYDHQSNLNQGGMPLMVIDAWEHAYYLQYKNQKTEFFKAVWNLWSWADVASRFETAREVNLQLPEAAAAAGRSR